MISLENDHVKVDFDESSGSICGIFDRLLNRQYLTEKEFARSFRLILPTRSWHGHHLDSWSQKVSRTDKDGCSVTFYYDEPETVLGKQNLQITAIFELRDERLTARLSVKNHGELQVKDIMFPWLAGIGVIKDVDTDCMFLPLATTWHGPKYKRRFFPWKVLASNHFSWNRAGHKAVFRCPHELATGWIDYGCGDGGFGLDIRDKSFEPQDFYIEKLVVKDSTDTEKNRSAMSFTWVFYPHIEREESWASPDIVVKVHRGDWHIVADEHREWLEEWLKKASVPRRLSESLGWHFFFLKHQDGTIAGTYEDLPDMAKTALEAGIPNLLLFGWQEAGHDRDYPVFLPNTEWGGEQGLNSGLAEVRRMGVAPIPFFKTSSINTQTDLYKKEGYRWVVKNHVNFSSQTGGWARNIFDASVRDKEQTHEAVCPDSGSFQYMVETSKKIVSDYGFGNLHMDQIVCFWFCCYNPDHRHSKPQAAYPQGNDRLLAAIKKNLREENPEAIMIGEGMTDFGSQYIDAFWMWSQLEEPETLRYSLPWVLFSHETDANEYGDANRCFVYGILLDLKIDGGDGRVTEYPRFAEHLKRLARLKRRIGDYYTYARFRDEEGVTYDSKEGIVLAKTYLNKEKKKFGIVICNASKRETSTEIHIKIPQRVGRCRVFSSDGDTNETKLGETMKVTLPPLSVKAACFDDWES